MPSFLLTAQIVNGSNLYNFIKNTILNNENNVQNVDHVYNLVSDGLNNNNIESPNKLYSFVDIMCHNIINNVYHDNTAVNLLMENMSEHTLNILVNYFPNNPDNDMLISQVNIYNIIKNKLYELQNNNIVNEDTIFNEIHSMLSNHNISVVNLPSVIDIAKSYN